MRRGGLRGGECVFDVLGRGLFGRELGLGWGLVLLGRLVGLLVDLI